MGIEFIALILLSFLGVEWLASFMPSRQNRVNFQIFCCFIILFVFFCMRDLPILNDTGHYYGSQYKLLSRPNFDDESVFDTYMRTDRYEYLFQVWSRIIAKYIWSDAYAIIFITGLLVTISNLWLIRKFTDHSGCTMVFLFLFLCFMYSANRQAYAMMLFFIALKYLINRKYLKYYGIVLVAYFFHRSAWILAILPLFMNIQLRKRNVVLLFSVTIAIAIFVYPLLMQLGFEENHYVVANKQREAFPLAALLNVLFNGIILYMIWYITKKFGKSGLPDIITWCSILCVAIGIISIPVLIFARYAIYFEIILIVQFMHMAYEKDIRQLNSFKGVSLVVPKNWMVSTMVALSLIRMIVVLIYREEWFHLTPYGFYDFMPGFHEYRFGY